MDEKNKEKLDKFCLKNSFKNTALNPWIMCAVLTAITTSTIAYYQYHALIEKEKIITSEQIFIDMNNIDMYLLNAKEICMEKEHSSEKKIELKFIKDKIYVNIRDIASKRSALMKYFGDPVIDSAKTYITKIEDIAKEIPKCSGQINEDSFIDNTIKIRLEFQEYLVKNV